MENNNKRKNGEYKYNLFDIQNIHSNIILKYIERLIASNRIQYKYINIMCTHYSGDICLVFTNI